MAADLNSVALVGRLTRDIEVRYTPTGVPVGRIGLANSRRTKKGETWVDETNFFDITLFGKSAESLAPYLSKGQQIAVQGELRYESWEKDGQKFNRVSVVANTLQLVGSRPNPSGQNVVSHSDSSSLPPTTPSAPLSPTSFDEDIPF